MAVCSHGPTLLIPPSTHPLRRPEAASQAYWHSVPDALVWPVVVIATAATIIASQALITGSFSIVQQARFSIVQVLMLPGPMQVRRCNGGVCLKVRTRCPPQAMATSAFPRLTVKHTSKHIMGQARA